MSTAPKIDHGIIEKERKKKIEEATREKPNVWGPMAT
jgi:hypothetical protein